MLMPNDARRRRGCRQRRSGFTLLELVLVLSLLVLVAAMSWPSFDAWFQGHRLGQAVDIIRTQLIRARTQAMEEGRPYRFYYETGTGVFRIAPDEVENWPELAGAAFGPRTSSMGLAPGLMLEDSLPEGVQILSPLAQAPPTFSLEADGTAKLFAIDGSEMPVMPILFMDVRGTSRLIEVRAVTGSTSVVTGNPMGL
jgi:prepilin-type N-terminal cleavage/methylation domain-containing protein